MFGKKTNKHPTASCYVNYFYLNLGKANILESNPWIFIPRLKNDIVFYVLQAVIAHWIHCRYYFKLSTKKYPFHGIYFHMVEFLK